MNYADFTNRNPSNPIQSDQSVGRSRPTGGIVRRKDYNAFTYNSFKVDAEGPILATLKTQPAKVGNQFFAAENSLNTGDQKEKLGDLHKVTVGEPEVEISDAIPNSSNQPPPVPTEAPSSIPDTPPPPADMPPLPPDIPPPPTDMPPLPPDIPPPPADMPPLPPDIPPPPTDMPPLPPDIPPPPTDMPPLPPDIPPPPADMPPLPPDIPPPPIPNTPPPSVPTDAPPANPNSSSSVSKAKQEEVSDGNPQKKLSLGNRLLNAIKNIFSFNGKVDESKNVDYSNIDIILPLRSYETPSLELYSASKAEKEIYNIVNEISETEINFKNIIKGYEESHKAELSSTSRENLEEMVKVADFLASKFTMQAVKFSPAIHGKGNIQDIVKIYTSPEFKAYANYIKMGVKEILESEAYDKRINESDKKAAKLLGNDVRDIKSLRENSEIPQRKHELLPRNGQTINIVQRLPRHELFIKDLIKQLPPDSEEQKAMQLVLAQIQEINQDINSLV